MNTITESKAEEWYCEKNGKFFSKKFFEKNKKKVLIEYLSELFDPVYSDDYNFFNAKEPTQQKAINIDGDVFEVECLTSKILDGFFRFSFKRVKSQYLEKPIYQGDIRKFSAELYEFEYGVSNSPRAIKTLKTIQSILYTFIKKYNPRGISFMDYDRGRREKVYSYVAKKICKETGYSLMEKNNYFFLFKDKNDMISVKKNLKL
jgi:hypothetical protein